ncbi:hypothetical protein J2D73_13955 [Acetobacter sacchari]|uniref:Uncharacterized protein n=1 Tax=Acetobacter sacchari TaxID=2661687 RepID=A0ABS3LY95_9PROT|nr:hypothetical protein [Acetobacter sacchari]MBO1360890.1 hypothetical protein [Acetobacter sacchari]
MGLVLMDDRDLRRVGVLSEVLLCGIRTPGPSPAWSACARVAPLRSAPLRLTAAQRP